MSRIYHLRFRCERLSSEGGLFLSIFVNVVVIALIYKMKEPIFYQPTYLAIYFGYDKKVGGKIEPVRWSLIYFVIDGGS